ncbi:MAG: hypothetical protein WC444_06505 [Candidatus Paceibacterota bacterium]
MAKKDDPTPEQIEQFEKLQILSKEAEVRREIEYVGMLNKYYTEAALYKQQHTQDWARYTKFLKGEQWPVRRPSHKVSSVINFTIENIERKTALLTDSKPIPSIVPRSDSFQDTADILNDLCSAIFEQSVFGQGMSDVVYNGQVFGAGFTSTVYDRSGGNGRGEILVPSVDPRAAYFDPLVIKSYNLCEGEYFIVEDVWALSKAQDIYPKVADRIKADAGLTPFRQAQQHKGFLSTLLGTIFQPQGIQDPHVSAVPRVYIREFWLKDRSKTERGKPEFKNMSRKSVLIGDVVLADDGENPYDDGEFPQDMLSWHADPDCGWSWGDVELLTNPQEQFNKLLATILENAILMSNAIWVGDADALTKEEWIKLTNAPGSHVKKRPGRELRREAGVALPQYVFEVANFLKVAKDEITGMVDVMRGIRTGQVSSGVGIEALQMAAQALVRLRGRAIEAMHMRIGRKLISRIFQFYEPERIFEVLRARQSKYEQQIKEIESELLRPVSKRKERAWLDVVFQIEPGSSLQLVKQERKQQSMNLRKMQVIDDRALLEDLEYPHREDVLKRVEMKRQDEQNQEVTPQQPASHAGASTQFPNQSGGSPAANG